MSFQWLQMRITEETERRQREMEILDRLPRVFEEVHQALVACVESYVEAFGTEALELRFLDNQIGVTVRELHHGTWEKIGTVDITMLPKLPGMNIDRNGDPLQIEVGLLPGENLFYKDGDQFLTMEELTRRILDRALFPKLGD